MTITLTGSKYSGGISTVGTTTRLIDSASTFLSSDFVAQRIIGLWTSTGTYKGVAWIRQWIGATELELEQSFIDKNGSTVTQVTGDTYQVSKNFTDSATTGLVVSANQVTITDNIYFGSAGSGNSLCFYDENQTVIGSVATGQLLSFQGGLTVFGHLSDYAGRSFYNACNFLMQSPAGDQIKVTSTSAKVWYLGGSIIAANVTSRMPGGTSGSPAEWQKYWGVSTNLDFVSPTDGAAWASNSSSQQVVNLNSSVSDSSICLRWADGVVEGGSFSAKGTAYSIFGSDSAGSFSLSAPPSRFIIVRDCGTTAAPARPALWRSGSTPTQNITYTNVVSPKRNHISGAGPSANNNATGTFLFSGLYTGLIDGTLALIKNNNLLSTVQNSAIAVSNQAVLTVQEAVVVGVTETVTENSWAYGFYLYGYGLISGTAITTTTVSVVQTSKRVVLGGFVGQILDVNISQTTVATVAAYTVLATFDQLYDYAQYYKSLNTANAIYPTISSQLISSASGLLSTPVAHSLTIDSSAASVFAVSANTITIKPLSAIASGVKSGTFNLSPGKTLTFAQNGDKSGAVYLIPSAGVVVVAPGSTDLRKSIFASGSTINVSSGTATVTVDSVTGITAGTGVTVQAPLVFVSAPNFAQNTRVQVARLEPYSVPSTAIATATNTITIAGNRFKSASPATLVYFQLQTGATIPTTTPQIANNTLYFVQAANVADGLAAGQFKLSLTQSGAAIVFSTQGTGNFTLTGITELDNSLAGASGYSVAFTEPNNTLLRVSAQFWQNTTGCTATNFYQQNIIWNAASGNAIADTVNVNSNPDTIHNSLTGNSTKVFNTIVTLPSDGSLVTGISYNAQGIISLDPRLFTSVAGFPTLTPQTAYLYTVYYRSTAAGIRVIANQFSAQDSANFVFSGLKLDNIADGVRNTPNTPATIAGGYVGTSDGSNPISITSGAIYINADRRGVLVTTTSGSTIAPSQQQIRDALTIPASSTVAAGSIDSKLALIPTADSSIPIAAIKTQTDKFVFTTVGRVDATAIGVPTNPVLISDARLSNLDALVSSRASQTALNAIPINPLLTTDTRLNNLDALVSSRASQTTLNAIPTNPVLITDSRLSNLDALVSSRASQITLNAIPTNPVLISDSRLSNLDALVSSRATQASINALPTLTAIEGSIVLFKSSNYTAPDNAGIGSLNSKLTTIRTDGLDRLPNLDALVTSRATPDQVWAVSYLSLTQVGTIGRLLYWIGKMFGATSTTVTASNTARTTGDGTINQTITTNADGSKTMSGNP